MRTFRVLSHKENDEKAVSTESERQYMLRQMGEGNTYSLQVGVAPGQPRVSRNQKENFRQVSG